MHTLDEVFEDIEIYEGVELSTEHHSQHVKKHRYPVLYSQVFARMSDEARVSDLKKRVSHFVANPDNFIPAPDKLPKPGHLTVYLVYSPSLENRARGVFTEGTSKWHVEFDLQDPNCREKLNNSEFPDEPQFLLIYDDSDKTIRYLFKQLH